MIQTLDLPVLSLAIPNIHKLNDINADNLSCMWTVFSKCKDNLENGRRLENMSWRLWYRESSLKETQQQSTVKSLSSPSPIPIQSSPVTATDHSDKHLSPASFKRIISSLNENEIIVHQPQQLPKLIVDKPQQIMFEQPKPTTEHSKFFIKEDEESDLDYEDEDGWSSEEEEESTPKDNACTMMNYEQTQQVQEEEDDDDDQYEDINDDDDNDDESAFLSEFRKRSPINVTTKGCSLLSNMLRAQGITRLANQPINVPQNQKLVDVDELSTSMRKCVEWEQHGFQHDFILNPIKTSNYESSSSSLFDDSFSRVYW